MKLFDLDSNTKQLLREISTLMGVKQDIVKNVWKYTIYLLMLNIADRPENFQKLVIPYIGDIVLKSKGKTVKDDGSFEEDIESYLTLNPEFKELYSKVCQGQYDLLADYFKENYIDQVVGNMDQ